MNPAAVDLAFNERLRRHEAAHAAAALTLSLDVHEIWVGTHNVTDLTWDSEGAAGCTRIEAPNTPDGHRLTAISIMAGPLEDRQAGWPRPWPLPRVDLAPDEWDFSEHVRAAGLDEHGYQELVADAKAIVETPEFGRLHESIVAALTEPPHTLGTAELKHLHKRALMEHITLKAIATTTDLGTFEAVISTEAIDREKDIVSAPAMVAALTKWNRPIPLAWNHSTNAADIFGTVNPHTVKAVNGEVVASGQVDLDSDVGREAWRSFKSRAIGFSFGYMVITATKRDDGGRHITVLDVFEVSATSTPMNNSTRVLGTKAADTEAERVRTEYASLMTNLLGERSGPKEPERSKALDLKRLEREITPIQVESFPC